MTNPNNRIIIREEDFSVDEELSWVNSDSPNIGASVVFSGSVRDVNGGLITLNLEHYPEMTKKALEKITEDARSRWDLGKIVIIHRVGELRVGEQIVLVISSSAHRKDAFSSCEFIMDYLKNDAPFWKSETTDSGKEWVEKKKSDIEASNRWK
jgi:molybdopterin synthase catalytic subunit